MLVRWPSEHPRVFPALSPVRSERREHPSRGCEHLPGQTGPPTSLSGLRSQRRGAGMCALGEPPQGHIHGVVEPDDCVRPRPHQVADGALVAVRDPTIPRDCRACPLAQQGQGRFAEVRTEVQRVQLNMGNAESNRKLSRESGLAGPGPPKYQNPLASCQAVQGIALLLWVWCGMVRGRGCRDRRLRLPRG
jgi:hypothetical protein